MAYSIITITAPSSASYGKVINFGIGIKNTVTVPGIIAWEYRVYCWAPDQSPINRILYDQVKINVGAVKVYTFSFLMPNKNAEIFVWVERLRFQLGKPAEWPYDSSKLKKVSLAVLPLPGVKLLARSTRYVALQVIEPPPVVREVQLVARHVAEVGVAKELYVLARASQVIIPAFVGVTLLDKAEQVIIAGDIAVIKLDARDVIVDAVGEPVEPVEPEVEVNWWLWGGLAVVAVVVVAAVVKGRG